MEANLNIFEGFEFRSEFPAEPLNPAKDTLLFSTLDVFYENPK